MTSSLFERALDYFPIIAFFGFWLQGAAVSSLITGDPRLMALGVITVPAIAAMIVAVIKIRKSRQSGKDTENERSR